MPELLWGWVVVSLGFALLVGLHFGKQREASRWRHNASIMFRIESAGRLFKVREVTYLPKEPEREAQ